jgi:HAD superfamily hydrolase (TIGR01509 family)
VARLAGTDSETVRAAYHSHNRAFQVGSLSQKQLWRRVASDLRIEDRFQDLWDTARARLPRIDHEVLAFVDQVRAAGYRTGLLSNLAPRTPWHEQLYREGVDRHFDTICLSGDTGLAKPDPAAFADLAQKMGVAPGELVFIDDRPQAFQGVERLGVHTVAYSDLLQLRHELRSLGCSWPTMH